jgi:hypothetical protein
VNTIDPAAPKSDSNDADPIAANHDEAGIGGAVVLRDGEAAALSAIPDRNAKHTRPANRLDRWSDGKRRAYSSWRNARQRCRNPKNRDYPAYGGRGIGFAAVWDFFEAFHVQMGNAPPGHTLDRIDPNGDYCPGNCRWALPRAQARNRRSNHRVEHREQVHSIAEWADETSIPADAISARLARGWESDRALGTPYRPRPRGFREGLQPEEHRRGGAEEVDFMQMTLDELARYAFTVPALEMTFSRACAETFPGFFVRPWRSKQFTLVDHLLHDVPLRHAGRIVVTVVRNWVEFVSFTAGFGEFVTPEYPTIEFVCRNLGAATNFYAKKAKPLDVPDTATFEQILAAIDLAEKSGSTPSPTPKANGSSSTEGTAQGDV